MMKNFISFKYGIFILHIIVHLLKIIHAARPHRELYQNRQSSDFSNDNNANSYQGIIGQPGNDYPTLQSIPRTKFDCKGQKFGYYADLETRCQVFHVCEDGRKTSFLCPNGTIFHQTNLICDWWHRVDCNSAPNEYDISVQVLENERLRRKNIFGDINMSERGHSRYKNNEITSTSSGPSSIRTFRRRVLGSKRRINNNNYLQETQIVMESKSFVKPSTQRPLTPIYSPTVPLVTRPRSTKGPTYLPYISSPGSTITATPLLTLNEIPNETNAAINSASLLLSVAQHLAAERDNVTAHNRTESDNANQVNTTLPPLLTNQTLKDFYTLFTQKSYPFTTVRAVTKEPEVTDLKIGESNGPKLSDSTPKIRYLAQVFANALSSYFYDPREFRKNLVDIRPTAPPAVTKGTPVQVSTTTGDYTIFTKEADEVLDFSDIEAKNIDSRRVTTEAVQTTAVDPTTSLPITTTRSKPNPLALNINSDLNPEYSSANLFLPLDDLIDLTDNDLDTKNTVAYYGYGLDKGTTDAIDTTQSTTNAFTGRLWDNTNQLSLNYNLEDEIPKTNPVETSTETSRIKLGAPMNPDVTLNDLLNTSEFDLAKTRANQLFGDLTLDQQAILMEKMTYAEHNSTVRKLIMLLVNTCNSKELRQEYGKNRTEQDIRKMVLSTLLNYPTDEIKEHLVTSPKRTAVTTVSKRRNIATKNNLRSVLKSSENEELRKIVESDDKLSENEIDQNTRALELLKTLYSYAARWV